MKKIFYPSSFDGRQSDKTNAYIHVFNAELVTFSNKSSDGSNLIPTGCLMKLSIQAAKP